MINFPLFSQETRVAIIGDYGVGIWSEPAENEEAVADLVDSWHAESPLSAVVTVGDNNYAHGLAEDIDENVGQYYQQYIYPYNGMYGNGNLDQQNLFFPAVGDHDYGKKPCDEEGDISPHTNYFNLPGNERYYDKVFGEAHFFIYNSVCQEPDGVDINSIQAQWLQNALAASNKTWKIVIIHSPPFSSGVHHDHPEVQFPYKEWGADAVISGDNHSYERLLFDGFPYFISGNGGNNLTGFPDVREESEVRYNAKHGAMLLTFSATEANFKAINVDDEVIDDFTLFADGNGCDNQGGDSDGDNVCDDVDCAPNDPNFPMPIGTSCDDNNPNTINDVIIGDGCSCAGTFDGELSCDDIMFTVDGSNILFSNLFGDDQIIKVYNEDWSQVLDKCNSFNDDNCAPTYIFEGDPNTTYFLTVHLFGSPECQETYMVTTVDDHGCLDSDNDSHCDDQDCQPNNPSLPLDPGTSCDDNNPNTNNDVILGDGCTCEGETVGNGTCESISVTTDGADVIVGNLFGDDQIIKIYDASWNVLDKCKSFSDDDCAPTFIYEGNPGTTYNVTIQIFGDVECDKTFTVTTNSALILSDNGLSLFQIKKNEISTEVKWIMNKDVLIDFYELEKSIDGELFTKFKQVNARRAEHLQQYEITDLAPVIGENFYRLKIQRLDGSYYYSKIRRVNFDIDFDQVTIYPNPTDKKINVLLRDFAGKSGTIEIFNSEGKKMLGKDYVVFPSIPASFNVSDFENGIYTISIKVDGHKRFTKKIVVSKL